jgi:uncharacterized damage-inducible protein DinB
MLGDATLVRLKTQLDLVPLLLEGSSTAAIAARPPSGQWSAHENLAHLARHHQLFLKRLRRILDESEPELDQYRAESDPDWPEWSALTTDEVLSRLFSFRKEITTLIVGLSEEELSRAGIHPLFGKMSLARWLEFFLLHEAHHLYLVMIRLGQAQAVQVPPV